MSRLESQHYRPRLSSLWGRGDQLRRFIICLGLLATVAVLSAQADPQVSATSPVRVISKSVEAGYNGASLNFTLSRRAKVTLNIGTDRKNTLALRSPSAAQSQSFDPGCLGPNRLYYYSLVAPTAQGNRTIDQGQFMTNPVPDQPVEAQVVKDHITIGGRPCFPIISAPTGWGVFCPQFMSVDDQLTLGVSVIASGDACGSDPAEKSRELHQALWHKAWFLVLREVPPDYRLAFPEKLDFHLSPPQEPISWGLELPESRGICGNGSFLYDSRSSLHPLMLVMYIGGSARCFSPDKLSALLWLTVRGGTTGLIYYDTVGTPGGFTVRPDLVRRAQLLSDQVATIGPVLFGQRKAVKKVRGGLRVSAWRYQGTTYVLAGNGNGKKSIKGSFTLAGSKTRRATVLWEGRSVKVARGTIHDLFKPLGVHWYRVP
jgi:hypothetical protein